MRSRMFQKLLIGAAIAALLVSPVVSERAHAVEVIPDAASGVALAPFAGFLALGFAVVYLDATQTGPNDGPFNAMFPVVEQTYPDSGHHKGH